MSSLEYELGLLAKMVAINTDSVSKEGYEACASLIVNEAKRIALDVEIVDGEKGAKDGQSRPNVIVTRDAGSDVTLLLESHFDIVPPGPGWTYPPFQLTVEHGKAYGRGAADNKSGIVAALGAFQQLREAKLDVNLKLIAGVDEEIGGRYGADYVVSDSSVTGDAALVLDAGPERLFLGASGLLWGKVLVQGIQGHAGYPFNAKNAIEEALKFLKHFDEYRILVEHKQSVLPAPPEAYPRQFVWGRCTVTMIKAGEKENIIPGTCEVRFDRRLLPEESMDEAEQGLIEFFQHTIETTGCNASLEIINRLPGYYTPNDHVFVQTVSAKINELQGHNVLFAGELGGNDGSFFAKKGIPVVCHGPIRADTRFHGVNEFVYLDDIATIRNLIVNLGKVDREDISPLRSTSD